jgi:hypothetical protein
VDFLKQLMRLPYTQGLWTRFPIGPVQKRVEYGIYPRPHYAYGVYWAAFLAKQLKIPRITVIEFGVAGGRGLIALEQASIEIGSYLGVQIDVVGFDSGEGMPPPVDYRDLPHIWNTGFYKMEQEKLLPRLRIAKLIIGDIHKTVREWVGSGINSPIGFVAFDLDYYSSTVAAFAIFDAPESSHLPRVHTYFDDLASNNLGCMNTFVGEYLAIGEFNERHSDRKICRIEQLRLNRSRWEHWQERMYAFHDFAHTRYTDLVLPSGAMHTQLPL